MATSCSYTKYTLCPIKEYYIHQGEVFFFVVAAGSKGCLEEELGAVARRRRRTTSSRYSLTDSFTHSLTDWLGSLSPLTFFLHPCPFPCSSPTSALPPSSYSFTPTDWPTQFLALSLCLQALAPSYESRITTAKLLLELDEHEVQYCSSQCHMLSYVTSWCCKVCLITP